MWRMMPAKLFEISLAVRTVKITVRIACRRRLCSRHSDMGLVDHGFVVAGGRVENVGDGLFDHQRQDKMRRQPGSGQSHVPGRKLVDAKTTLETLEGEFDLPAQPIDVQNVERRGIRTPLLG